MLVRSATPPDASGKVYGFVYSGLDSGLRDDTAVLRLLLDRGEPRRVFVILAIHMVLTIATVSQVRRRASLWTVTVCAP